LALHFPEPAPVLVLVGDGVTRVEQRRGALDIPVLYKDIVCL
jgi:hypothetical protein